MLNTTKRDKYKGKANCLYHSVRVVGLGSFFLTEASTEPLELYFQQWTLFHP